MPSQLRSKSGLRKYYLPIVGRVNVGIRITISASTYGRSKSSKLREFKTHNHSSTRLARSPSPYGPRVSKFDMMPLFYTYLKAGECDAVVRGGEGPVPSSLEG